MCDSTPVKKNNENIVLNIIFADAKVRPNVPESIKNSAIEWKLKRWTCHFLYTTKTAISQRGVKDSRVFYILE